MASTALLAAGLLALIAPAPWSAAALLPCLLAGRGRGAAASLAACTGALLLACAAALAAPSARPAPPAQAAPSVQPAREARAEEPRAPPDGAPHAVRLRGTLRSPPRGETSLATPAGLLPIAFAGDLRLPLPGTPVEILARCTPGSPPQAVALRSLGPPRGAWLDRWAIAAAARARRLMGREHFGVGVALVLGQRDGLPFPVLADCIATGTMHLLALSGLHLALLVGALQRVGAGAALVPLATVVAGFVALAGAQPPLLRSGIGWALARIGQALARPGGDGLRRLGAVALLMECWQPGLHRELSAQLSFLAVAGLIAAARLVRGPLSGIVGAGGAFLATAPLCAETFGRVQPAGVLVTVVLVPVVSMLLALGLVAVLPLQGFAALDALTGPALAATAWLLRELLALAASLCPPPLEPAELPLPGWAASLVAVAALAVLSRALGARGRGGRQEVYA